MLKQLLRSIKRVFFLVLYSFYDFYRYLVYSSLVKANDGIIYKIIKIYHRLEKSLSFKNRNRKSGKAAALDLMRVYKNATKDRGETQYKVGLRVLEKYIVSSDVDDDLRRQADELLLSNSGCVDEDTKGGVLDLNIPEMVKEGRLSDPEGFFFSRYSIRNFSKEKVDGDLVSRALNLASKTPSVCNRQEWAVYHVEDEIKISKVLELQNGNKGFGDKINSLLVIATDLKAFEGASERFQNWIDGGLYTMSLVYAFHSLGVSSCVLNLCNSPLDDIRLRKIINANAEHSFVVMMAIGYPEIASKVCVSARTSPENYYFKV